MKRKYNITLLFALCLLSIFSTSCVDDQIITNTEGVTGQPTTIQIKMLVPEMTVKTRSLTEEQENQVNDLWLAIYAEDGTRTYFGDQNITSHDDAHAGHLLSSIKTKSGRSYIVAVANYKNNNGVSDLIIPGGGTEAQPLATLLENADTFDKFKSIAVSLASPTQVDYAEAQLPMSGVFVGGSTSNTHANTSWENLPAFYIPASSSAVTLNGYLHLRRLVSKVNFIVRAPATPSGEAPTNQTLIVRPTSWKLVNTPRISYLYEQEGNAADAVKYYLSEQTPNANYNESLLHTEIEKIENNDYPSYFTFSYYQFENKHTGRLTRNMTYADRDREYKSNGDTGTNTGVYVSLCENSEHPDLLKGTNVNNFASYIELTADINYTANITDPDNQGQTISVPRTGEATFVIHLGAIGHSENTPELDILNDFNVHRNSIYNYTVTIRGVDDIVVEAQQEGERRPGVEGSVTDATLKRLDVDAHYVAFNIQLNENERRNLAYEIVAPFAGRTEILTVARGESFEPDDNNRKFYEWIRILPTTGENILAAYNPDAWYMEDLKDVGGYPGNTSEWYTVFLDEYTYDGENWQDYVNQDDRTVLFLIQDYAVSADEESKYSIGKYYVRQKSIQTYYSTEGNVNETALGVEHINESYGKKLQWTWGRSTNSNASTSLSNTNGRWNVWTYLTNRHNNNNDFTTDNNWTTAGRTWNSIIRYCNANGNYNASRTSYMQADPTYPVPLLQYSETASNYTYDRTTYSTRAQDPESNINNGNAYFEVVASCMNRNRDLNGDGQITGNELRWYLPAEGKYERIMLGRSSLATPLFSTSAGDGRWCNSNDDNIPANNWGYDGIIGTAGSDNEIHFVSSNGCKFFPEEGGSFNRNFVVHWAGGYAMRVPWNIRCVRNLSANAPGDVILDRNTEPVAKAYSYDTATRTFDMGKYDSKSIRPKIETFMAVHPLTELNNNRIARKFKVSLNYATGDATGSTMEAELNANRPCGDYSEDGDGGATWRAPNQRELMMLVNEERILDPGRSYYSCTKEGYGGKSRFSVASVDGDKSFIGSMIAPAEGTFYIRCVRDIE